MAKPVIPNISFSKRLEPSRVMIQFDEDEPESVAEIQDEDTTISFTLQNTEFSSIEFQNKKTNKKFKIFIDKKNG